MSALSQSAFDRAAEVLRQLSTTANVKQVRERLPALASEVRSTADPSTQIPELAEQIDAMAERFEGSAGNNKAEVGPKLAELLTWIQDHRPVHDIEATSRIQEIESQIKALGEQAARSMIRIGGLLKEARDEYDSKDTGAFLAWAEGNFGFKKSYVYRMIKVYDTFGADPLLSTVSPNALAFLTGADDKQLDKARELAGRGELTQAAAKELSGKGAKPPQAPPEEPKAPTMPEVIEGPKREPQNVTPSPAPNPDKEPGEVREVPRDEYWKGVVESLQATIEELRDQLRSAQQDRENGKRKSQAMPSLPQFKSKSMPARLGLDAEEAKDAKAVRSAFRGLVKAGYGDGHPDHDKLAEAVEALTAA